MRDVRPSQTKCILKTRAHLRVFICVPVVALLSSLSITFAQPRYGPPPSVSADEAARAIGGPTLVTLHFKNAPPVAIFESLAKQAGLSLVDSAPEALRDMRPISVDVEKQPFWVVVRQLAARCDLRFGISPDDDFGHSERGWALSLEPGRDASLHGPGQISGPFLVIASNVARLIQLTEDGLPPKNQQLIIEFVLLVDPKLSIRGEPEGMAIEILGDKGVLSSNKTQDRWTHEVRSPLPLMWRFKAIANLPTSEVKKLSKVKGTLRGLLAATGSKRWEIADVWQAKQASQVAGEAQFVVRGVTRQDIDREPQYTVTLTSAGPGEEPDVGWPSRSDHDLVSGIRLLDSQGHGFFPQSWNRKASDFVVNFRPGERAGPATNGAPVKLVWELPTQVVEIEIPFEFVDLPLP